MISKNYVQNPAQIKTSLMKSCLETLNAFLSWIPLYYIFEIDILEAVLCPLIKSVQFCQIAIRCLTEIVSIKID